MTTRLHIRLDSDEIQEIRRLAHRHRMTVAEWVRQSLRQSREADLVIAQKLAVVREAARHDYPAGDIDQLLAGLQMKDYS